MSRTPQQTLSSDQALATDGTMRNRLFNKAIAGRGGCIIWTGATNSRGYGHIRTDGQLAYVHRVVHELLIGPIPEGMLIDHQCHNRDESCRGGESCLHRRCINPYHLEAVTPGENQRRSPHTFASIESGKTHCLHGHPFDAANTYVRKDNGGRQCRQCRNERSRRYRHGSPVRRDIPVCDEHHLDAVAFMARHVGSIGTG